MGGRAQALADDLRREFPRVLCVVGVAESEFLVNCSPAGMGHDAGLPLPAALIPQGGDVHDIVNRPDTP